MLDEASRASYRKTRERIMQPGKTNLTGSLVTERYRATGLAVMVAVGAGVCFVLARPFLTALAWAAALAIMVAPVYRWLFRRLRSANLTAGSPVALLAMAFVGIALAVVPGLVRTAQDGLQVVQTQIETGQVDELVQGRGRFWRALTRRSLSETLRAVWEGRQWTPRPRKQDSVVEVKAGSGGSAAVVPSGTPSRLTNGLKGKGRLWKPSSRIWNRRVRMCRARR